MEGMCVKFDVIGLDSPCVDLAVNVRCFPKPNGAERIQMELFVLEIFKTMELIQNKCV